MRVDFSAIETERRLEDVLAQDLGILDPELLLIGRQVPTAYGGFIDLLAMDREGNLVVIELKKDRTPREVVAQVLDYGSWIASLEDDDIAGIFEDYLQKHRSGEKNTSLDEAFCNKFGENVIPESLNESHELIVVAAELDNSTERIINYLTEFGVAVNAVFFRFFKDGGGEYLSRAWLIAPEQAEAKVVDRRERLPWNGEYYVSFGHRDDGTSRHWEDARKYGFISAGGGDWYTRTLNMLEPEGRVWVNIPQQGYVGVGKVLEGPVPAEKFTVTTDDGRQVPISELSLRGELCRPSDNEPGTEEQLVRVKWIKTVPVSQAVKEKGLFGNQNSAAKPRAKKWRHTVERLKTRLGISD
jgi:hypothetical protein